MGSRQWPSLRSQTSIKQHFYIPQNFVGWVVSYLIRGTSNSAWFGIWKCGNTNTKTAKFMWCKLIHTSMSSGLPSLCFCCLVCFDFFFFFLFISFLSSLFLSSSSISEQSNSSWDIPCFFSNATWKQHRKTCIQQPAEKCMNVTFVTFLGVSKQILQFGKA